MTEVIRIGFTELKHDIATTGGPFRVNIIFVHGLKGHPQLTWEDKVRSHIPRESIFRLFSRMGRTKSSSDNAENKNSELTKSKIFWPRDFLSEDIPDARVWTYGYNADIVGGLYKNNTQNHVSQHGRDLAAQFERDINNKEPVVFVAHSLGGIVVKDALHRSEVCRSRTRLVVFLGTPHRGSSIAGWGVIASNIANLALQDTNTDILRTLDLNGQVFDGIHERFVKIVQDGGVRVHSFQEARGISGMRGASNKVVEDFSSKIGLGPPLEIVESIDANHMEMARCRTKTDSQYRAILGVLRRFISTIDDENDSSQVVILSSAATLVPHIVGPGAACKADGTSVNSLGVWECKASHSSAPQPVYHIPLGKNLRFIGREEILMDLEERFFGAQPCQRLALVGLGGAGKTQISLRFVYNIKQNRPEYSVLWVPVLSSGSVEQAFYEIAIKLGIKENDDEQGAQTKLATSTEEANNSTKPNDNVTELVCQYLSTEKAGKWILVIDNADDYDLVLGSKETGGIEHLLPQSDNGLILMTTRSRQVAVDFAQSDIIDVEQLGRKEGLEMLGKLLVEKQKPANEIATKLLDRLTYLPLAIAQAAAYMNQTKMTPQRYLEVLEGAEEETTKLLSREFRDQTRYRDLSNAVARTWAISFDQIAKVSPMAIDLLSFLSCLEPKGIPENALPGYKTEEGQWAIGLLCGYSFLTRWESKFRDVEMFDMHSLVHSASRAWVEKGGRQKQVLEDTMCHLNDAWYLREPQSHFRRMYQQLRGSAWRMIRDSANDDSGERSDLASWCSLLFYVHGKKDEAIECAKITAKWRTAHSVAEDVLRRRADHKLCCAYNDGGRYSDTIQVLDHALAVERAIPNSPYLLGLECQLARAYMGTQRRAEALEILERVAKSGPVMDREDYVLWPWTVDLQEDKVRRFAQILLAQVHVPIDDRAPLSD